MPEIELRVGDVHEFELPGRGSAGYSWQIAPLDPEGAVEIRRLPPGPADRPELGGAPPPSGSRPERLAIEALQPGRVRVHLLLRRSWETDEPPLEERVLDIVIAT